MSEAAKKRRSFSMAYLMAQCGPVVAMPAGQPPTPDSAEKYSYNGVVLPKLPEWDKTVYPYAAIKLVDYDTTADDVFQPIYAELIVSNQPLFFAPGTYDKSSYLCAKNPVAYMKCETVGEDGTLPDGLNGTELIAHHWDNFTSGNVDTISKNIAEDAYEVTHLYGYVMYVPHWDDRVQWANHGISNLVTNEVYFEKSPDPVPVYE